MLRRVVLAGPTQATGAPLRGRPSSSRPPLDSHRACRNRGIPLGALEFAAADRQRQLRRAQRRAGLSPPPPPPRFEDRTALLADGAELRRASPRFVCTTIASGAQDRPAFAAFKDSSSLTSRGGLPPGPRRTAGSTRSSSSARRADRAPKTAPRPARSRLEPAFDRRSRGVGGVRAEAGRVVAHLLRLPGPQRHHGASSGAAAAHRRPPGRDAWCRRPVVTTDASEVAISAVLAQPDDAGHHHPEAHESRKRTAAEQAYPPHVLELLAVVKNLLMFRHYLLGSGASRPPEVLSDFTLRTDNQAVSWLRTKRDINRFLARRLDEIEEFRSDVEHVPGRLNPADPLTRRHFSGPDAGPGAGSGSASGPATAAAAVAGPGQAGAAGSGRGPLRWLAPLR